MGQIGHFRTFPRNIQAEAKVPIVEEGWFTVVIMLL